MDAVADSPRPHWLFTSETARLNAKKGVELRKQKAVEAEALQPKPIPQVSDASTMDPLAVNLAHVQEELVEQMKGNKDPKAVSALAMALKNTREVFHLVTGQAKPGVIRETSRSGRQRSQAKPQPLPDDGPDSDAKAQSG